MTSTAKHPAHSQRWESFCDALRELAVLEHGDSQGVLATGFRCSSCDGSVPSGIPECFKGTQFVICDVCVGAKDAVRLVRERVEHKRGIPDADLARAGWALVRARVRGEKPPAQASMILGCPEPPSPSGGGLSRGGGTAAVVGTSPIGATGSPPERPPAPRTGDGVQGREACHPVPLLLPLVEAAEEPER